MSDNYKVCVRAEGKDKFEAAIRLAFKDWPNATHYIKGLPERKCIECYGIGTVWQVPAGETSNNSIEIRCPVCGGNKTVKKRDALILLWHDKCEEFECRELPYPMDVDAVIPFLWNWLTTDAEYPPEPDIDGSCNKGFEVTTGDFWGHIEGLRYAILAVYPDFQLYGK